MQVHCFGHLSFSDEGQRIVMLRTDMNEMNIQPIDLGDELQKRLCVAQSGGSNSGNP